MHICCGVVVAAVMVVVFMVVVVVVAVVSVVFMVVVFMVVVVVVVVVAVVGWQSAYTGMFGTKVCTANGGKDAKCIPLYRTRFTVARPAARMIFFVCRLLPARAMDLLRY
jgi:hypothetical protein